MQSELEKLNRLRDQLQEQWATKATETKRAFLHISPRAGKTRTSIRVFCNVQRILKRRPRILVAYPDKTIKQSWEGDIQATGYKNPYVEYTTHRSISKRIGTNKDSYDIIVCDEIHLLSPKQQLDLKRAIQKNPSSYVLGLSGTLSKWTRYNLESYFKSCNIKVEVDYSINQAVKDGIISDYRINIVKTKLDKITIVDTKKSRTEKQLYDAYTWIIENRDDSLHIKLGRMKIINNSISKVRKTKKVLNNLKDQRVLVFCPNNKIAEELGCMIHTSKFNNIEEFGKFLKNKSYNNHVAVCKIANTGANFKDLEHIVINSFDSNSENLAQRICRSLIPDKPGKIANIYIITTDEKAELSWLSKALEFFDLKKIKYQ